MKKLKQGLLCDNKALYYLEKGMVFQTVAETKKRNTVFDFGYCIPKDTVLEVYDFHDDTYGTSIDMLDTNTRIIYKDVNPSTLRYIVG